MVTLAIGLMEDPLEERNSMLTEAVAPAGRRSEDLARRAACRLAAAHRRAAAWSAVRWQAARGWAAPSPAAPESPAGHRSVGQASSVRRLQHDGAVRIPTR